MHLSPNALFNKWSWEAAHFPPFSNRLIVFIVYFLPVNDVVH